LGNGTIAFRLGAILLIGALAQDSAGSAKHTKDLLLYSCFHKPYVGVTAKTPQSDNFAAIELRLTDPTGRTAGYGPHKKLMPHSRYGNVIELPKLPNRSKAVAVEVCGAEQGTYELEVREHDSQAYILTAQAFGGSKRDEFQRLNSVAQVGRVCRYRFYFAIIDKSAEIYWLDESGKALTPGEQAPCLAKY